MDMGLKLKYEIGHSKLANFFKTSNSPMTPRADSPSSFD